MTGENAICDALSDLLRSRTDWDEAPGPYFAYRDGGKVRLSPESLIPDVMWSGRPPEVLGIFAAALECAAPGMLAALAPRDLIGAAFRFESWTVITAAADAGRTEEVRAAARARKLSSHPGRVEQRCVWAVTRDGTNYTAAQTRGSDTVESSRADGSTGMIPDSLLRIIRAVSAGVN